MEGSLRRRLAGAAFGGLIAFANVPTATAQWLPPWRAAPPGAIEQVLEAQGYVLIAPLQRRRSVYLADVSAGPAGYQRLIIDAWSGDILQRFIGPARRWGPQLAAREWDFSQPPPSGFSGPRPGGGFSSTPDGGPASNSASGGPANVRIPAAISPFGSPEAPPATKPKPKKPGTTAAPPAPPPRPQDAAAPTAVQPASPEAAAKPNASTPAPSMPTGNEESDEPKTDSASTEVGTAPPASREAGTEGTPQASAAAKADLNPEASKINTRPEAQTQPSATAQSAGPAPEPTAKPGATADSSEKSKVNIVPGALFE
jgi:hypothetical protein